MAPQVGLEPTTLRLTAGCSAIELLRSVLGRARRARPLSSLSIISLAGVAGISKLRATARNFAAACFCGGAYVCRTTRYVHVQHPTCISPDNREYTSSFGAGAFGLGNLYTCRAGVGSF